MSKIKEIQTKFLNDPTKYAELRFLIAKQIFSLAFTLYFLAFLFTIGGFYFGPFTINGLAILRYHLYSLLIVSTVFFGYSLIEYLVSLHAPDKKILQYIGGGIMILFGAIVLVVHLGLIG